MPREAEYIISELEKNGYSAYAVGGCVRDSILGSEPKDWDICTSALPSESEICFEVYSILKTGLRHGTITLVLDNKPFEITTYRIDGMYTDNRRPDKVVFVGNLKDDLSRRDFTINAMVYNPKSGIVDYFGGIDDLNAKVIRCVGDADKRFQEDALRIMRALRFASVLGFSIEKSAAAALFNNSPLLKNIAAERINSEINKLLIGNNAINVLKEYSTVIADFTPEIQPKNIKRWLNRIGEEKLRLLIEIKGEIAGQHTNILHLLDEAVAQQRFSLKDLAVNGDDLIAIGIPHGVKIGTVLNRLRDMVVEGSAENSRDELLKVARIM